MRSRQVCLAGVMLLVVLGVRADERIPLEVTRVALFSSGVGYFERQAEVVGDASAELTFRIAQINDILKSMVVQDSGGGHVGIVNYASKDPLEKTLRSFGVDLTGDPTLGELLDQLRGEPVAISGAVDMQGTIVGVEKTRVLEPDGETVEEIEQLTVLTDAGLRRVALRDIEELKLTNEKIAAELRKALAVLATAHDADKKAVELNFVGQGQRRVRVGYMLEAPIWKTSYRLVLSDDEQPFLQGWANVENATEEDWNDVRLSLVSGRPISFQMDLYTPLYVRRPVEQLELYASLRPPDYAGGFELDEAPMVARRGRSAGGRGGRGVAVQEKAPPAPSAYFDAHEAGEEMIPWNADVLYPRNWNAAEGREAGELFEYRIDTPVSIPRQHAAMLPIVNETIEGEKLSIFNLGTHHKHPLNGLELTNTTDLHLMQGPVTVFDEGVYAGDAKLPDLNPHEKRLIAYALDLSTEVMIKGLNLPDEIVSLRIVKGTLWHKHKLLDRREYVIKNKGDRERRVLLEQPYSDAWTLVEPAEAYERTQNLLRFKVAVGAQATETFPVKLEQIRDQSIALTDMGPDQIRLFLKSRVITAEVRKALERVIQLRSELDQSRQRRGRLEGELREVESQQVRVRENIKVLQEGTDTYRRQLEKFDGFETQIERLREQIVGARDEEQQRERALEEYLRTLTVE